MLNPTVARKTISMDDEFLNLLLREFEVAKLRGEADNFSEYIIGILKVIFTPEQRYLKILHLRDDEIGHETLRATLTHLLHEAVRLELDDGVDS